MKAVIALCLVLICAVPPARAERPGVPMRAAGVSLTFTGVAMFVFGLSLMAAEAHHNATCGQPDTGPCGDARGLLMVPGGGLLAASTAFLGAGIPLWAVGQQRIKRSASFAIAPTVGRDGPGGVTASFKLTF